MSETTEAFVFRCLCLAAHFAFFYFVELAKAFKRVISGEFDVPVQMARRGCVIFRFKRDCLEIARREDFVVLDDGFVGFEELLEPEWMVYSIDKRGAVFVKMPKPSPEYSAENCPFLFMNMFEEPMETAEMSIEAYVAFAQLIDRTIEKPKETLFFTNTARCASTLFASMLSHAGHSICYAEPHVLTILATGFGFGYWQYPQLLKLVPATIKILRKNVPSDQVCILKTTSSEVKIAPIVRHTMPEVKQIFMFRRNATDSVERMLLIDTMHRFNLFQAFRWIINFIGYLTATEAPWIEELKPTHVKQLAFLLYAAPYSGYLRNKECFDFPVVWHDLLIRQTRKVLALVFEKLEIPLECIPEAVKRMRKDSQEGTKLSQNSIGSLEATPLTPKLEESLAEYAALLGVPKDVCGF
uniref:Uncharacterized protein n=1 Tax=Panagrellus redivivus TaxID=6233 RepID=A0A7E4WDM6_PANRE